MKYLQYYIAFLTAIVLNIMVESSFRDMTFNFTVGYTTMGLIAVFLVLLTQVKTALNRGLLYSWYYFYFCGTLYLNGAALQNPKFMITNTPADNYYFLNLITLAAGMILSEKIFYKRNQVISTEKHQQFPLVMYFFLLAFPLLFLGSTYLALGFLPIMSKESIVEDMYEYDYGPLYGYKFVIVMSILMSFFYSYRKNKQLFYLGLAGFFAAITLIDGKRVALLIAIGACLAFYHVYMTKFGKPNFKRIAIFLGLAGVMYISLSAIRDGEKVQVEGGVTGFVKGFPIGVEYTDYVYSFETYQPKKIPHYDLPSTIVGSAVNGKVLELLGYKKEDLIEYGSAYAWMKLYGIELGIRTGVVSELYFQCGPFLALFIMFLMGFYFDYINRVIHRVKDNFFLLIFCAIYSCNILLIVGQVDVYFGTLPVMLYISIFYRVVKAIADSDARSVLLQRPT